MDFKKEFADLERLSKRVRVEAPLITGTPDNIVLQTPCFSWKHLPFKGVHYEAEKHAIFLCVLQKRWFLKNPDQPCPSISELYDSRTKLFDNDASHRCQGHSRNPCRFESISRDSIYYLHHVALDLPRDDPRFIHGFPLKASGAFHCCIETGRFHQCDSRRCFGDMVKEGYCVCSISGELKNRSSATVSVIHKNYAMTQDLFVAPQLSVKKLRVTSGPVTLVDVDDKEDETAGVFTEEEALQAKQKSAPQFLSKRVSRPKRCMKSKKDVVVNEKDVTTCVKETLITLFKEGPMRDEDDKKRKMALFMYTKLISKSILFLALVLKEKPYEGGIHYAFQRQQKDIRNYTTSMIYTIQNSGMVVNGIEILPKDVEMSELLPKPQSLRQIDGFSTDVILDYEKVIFEVFNMELESWTTEQRKKLFYKNVIMKDSRKELLDET